MITILTGENDYQIQAAVRARAAKFSGAVEKHDGVELDLNQLANLLAGGGLFAEKKLVIISELSKNKLIWPVLPEWLARIATGTELVLIEPKLDKRTSTYKALKSAAEIKEFSNWSDRDQPSAVKWVINEAERRGLSLDRASAAELARRCMVATDKPGRADIDQWRLHFGIDILRAAESVNPTVVAELIEAEPRENSFELLEAALTGNIAGLQQRLEILRASEEPHRLFGLLSQQVYQLTAMAYADKPPAAVAKDLSAHPYVIEKLAGVSRRLGRRGVNDLALLFADADLAMKTTGQDPWELVEATLLNVAAK